MKIKTPTIEYFETAYANKPVGGRTVIGGTKIEVCGETKRKVRHKIIDKVLEYEKLKVGRDK